MELFVWASTHKVNMHEKLRVMGSVDICKQIFLYLSSWNFVQQNTAQRWVWWSPLCRVVHKGSYQIYFAIFGYSYKFLQILKVWTVFRELTKLEKWLNRLHNVGLQIQPTAYGARGLAARLAC
jgi:hypothetical protein